MRIEPQVAILMVSTTGIGFLMAIAGIHKSALEWRRRQRTCPSCGRHIRENTCRCTG